MTDILCSIVGLQGYVGSNTPNMPQPGVENLLVKRMALERQRSLPNPYSYWPPGRDPASLISKTEVVPDTKLIPPLTENSSQPHPQNADLMSVLQGLSDRSSSSVNNNVAGWPNFNVQSGPDLLQNKMDLHHDQSFAPQSPLGIQQQRLPLQNQPSFPNLFPQVVDNAQGISMPEKLLPSSLSQDPQLLNMLQQQYLLQLHSQPPVPAQQISLLDKLLLLKQQQKQEEQQMLLRQQQQQQLLSQVLSEHQNRQHFGELSFGQLPVSGMQKGNASIDPRLQSPQELFSIGSNMAVPSVQNELPVNLLNISSQVNQDNRYNAISEASLHLPHQMFDNVTHQKSWGAPNAEQVDEIRQNEPLPSSVGSSLLLGMMNKSSEVPLVDKSLSVSDSLVTKTSEQPSVSALGVKETTMVATSKVTADFASLEPHGVLDSVPALGDVNDVKVLSDGAVEEEKVDEEKFNIELSTMTEVKNVEVRELKKPSEKKSKKQKSSKAQSTDQAKGVSKTSSVQQTKPCETDKTFGDIKLETEFGIGDDKYRIAGVEVAESQPVQKGTASISAHDTESLHVEGDSKLTGSVAAQNTQVHTGQRAWKPAPGFKAKSLLEIQQEEQKIAQTETVVSGITTPVSSLSLSTPWAGVVANADPKVPRETQRDVGNSEFNAGKLESSQKPKSKKSQLHDLLAEEVLAKSSERDIDVPSSMSSLSSPQVTTSLSESVDDDNFIEAKDTKKSRKKSAKSKGVGNKVSVLSTSVDVPVSPSPAKSSRPVQQEKEVLPAIPSGPSLGDFVLWKGGEQTVPSPSPAWSTDSGKLSKPTSLRDILKEQERKGSSAQHVNQIPTPQKSQPTQVTRGSGPSWSLPGSSPSKAASPIQINSNASQSRHKGDDDLFWGPIEQTKQETKQYDFSQFCSSTTLLCLLAAFGCNFIYFAPYCLYGYI